MGARGVARIVYSFSGGFRYFLSLKTDPAKDVALLLERNERLKDFERVF